ncbi:MAG: TIGR00366 family protein [Enterobacterales bacterium]|nr:TIGR00366 family protein [Enterobacterales bacterium]
MLIFFVPSGGGQWAVQAPIVIPTAIELGVPINQAAMAVAWGDAWTNMIQPFWALPLLAIAKLSLRDIMGYRAVILIWSGLVISSVIYFAY